MVQHLLESGTHLRPSLVLIRVNMVFTFTD